MPTMLQEVSTHISPVDAKIRPDQLSTTSPLQFPDTWIGQLEVNQFRPFFIDLTSNLTEYLKHHPQAIPLIINVKNPPEFFRNGVIPTVAAEMRKVNAALLNWSVLTNAPLVFLIDSENPIIQPKTEALPRVGLDDIMADVLEAMKKMTNQIAQQLNDASSQSKTVGIPTGSLSDLYLKGESPWNSAPAAVEHILRELLTENYFLVRENAKQKRGILKNFPHIWGNRNTAETDNSLPIHRIKVQSISNVVRSGTSSLILDYI